MTTRRTVGLLDPSMSSDNMGDHIIKNSVVKVIQSILPGFQIVNLPTQRLMSRSERKLARNCSHFFVGGTNIINGNIPFYMQWKMDPEIAFIIAGRTIPIGVGWWKYQDATNRLSTVLWRNIFGHSPVSVRDSYTQLKMDQMGISSSNTSCPTMWDLPEYVNTSEKVSESVVVTLTDYKRDVESDLKLFNSLSQIYETVYLWPQGDKDRDYVQKLRLDVRIGSRDVQWFDETLAAGSDYVGTRLHAGVRAHQLGAHSVIISIDNRAEEIAGDTGLPIVQRSAHSTFDREFRRREARKLILPTGQIDQWKTNVIETVSSA